MIYIENEGALFRGPARAWPKEVWNGKEFTPYKGSMPKDVDWGDEIDEAAAKALMGGAEPGEASEQQEPAKEQV